MGCDGGTIPRRDELVKTKQKPEQKDKDSELIFQWRCCALTQEPLQSPIVMCGLGKLYNKVSLIEALLNKSSMPVEISHIKNLKDIKELNLTPNPSYKEEEVKEKSSTIGPSPFICPVIGLEMTGKFRFVSIWSCGCVFSERALKQIDIKICHKCQQPFEPDDVVILNGNEEDLVVMKERLAKRQAQQKKKKEKKVKTEPEDVPGPSTSSSTSVKNEKDKKSGPKLDKTAPNMSLNLKKRPGKLQESTVDTKKMKSDYSVAKDPQASDVYKSLFTSHKSEKEQNRAHWVTYNPFYN
ncbi:replication termination factor 2 [Coccinella septempunctata]|uniref:replication termination factor 2 n=1 Tax=Coccinella septempunctata TaxID=41139 RepID=UPI001D073180|nr:replication termination factor 2 [Coccinella septempunctata]